MSRNLIKAAGLLLIINVCVKLLGFGREMVIANKFGASSLSDAYLVAYTLPYMLQAILGYAFVSAVLPLCTRLWREQGDNSELFRLGSTLINITALAMLGLCLAAMAGAPGLVFLTAPAFSAETARLSINLTRIMFPSVIFMSAGMVISGILNSRYRFAAAAIAPGVAAVFIIAATMLSAGDIHIVAWGTLAGFIAFFLTQALDLPRAGFRYLPVCLMRHHEIRRVLIVILPIVLGLSVNQIYTVLNRVFASGLAEGSITVLNYANKLMNLPLGLFVAAIITAFFPALSEQAQKDDKADFTATVSRSLAMTLLISLPAMLGLMLLDTEIVRLLFQHGEFTAADVAQTAPALLLMSPGLPFFGLSMLLMRVYYALGDVKTPLLCGAASIVVNIGCSLLLTAPLAVRGLSLANSLAALTNALLLLYLLRKRIDFGDYLRRNSIIAAAASAMMAAAVFAAARLLPQLGGRGGLLLWLALLIGGGIVVYLGALKLLRSETLDDILRELRKKRAA